MYVILYRLKKSKSLKLVAELFSNKTDALEYMNVVMLPNGNYARILIRYIDTDPQTSDI